MPKIHLVDTNPEVISAVTPLLQKFPEHLVVINDDVISYYNYIKEERPILCTASNEQFMMLGGLDRAIKQNFYPDRQPNLVEGELYEDFLLPLVTIGNTPEETENNVLESFVCIQRTIKKYNRDIIVTGIGTGIAGLPIEKFVMIFEVCLQAISNKEVILFTEEFNNYQNFLMKIAGFTPDEMFTNTIELKDYFKNKKISPSKSIPIICALLNAIIQTERLNNPAASTIWDIAQNIESGNMDIMKIFELLKKFPDKK